MEHNWHFAIFKNTFFILGKSIFPGVKPVKMDLDIEKTHFYCYKMPYFRGLPENKENSKFFFFLGIDES